MQSSQFVISQSILGLMNIITRLDNSLTRYLNHWGAHHVGLIKFLSDDLVYIVILASLALVLFNTYQASSARFELWGFTKELVRTGVTRLVIPVGLATIVSELISAAYVRQRPFAGLSGIKLLVPHGGDGGMPSHHMVFMATIVEVIAGFNRSFAIFLGLLTWISGIARVSAGIHYPTDIVAGLALGWFVAWVYGLLLNRVAPRGEATD